VNGESRRSPVGGREDIEGRGDPEETDVLGKEEAKPVRGSIMGYMEMVGAAHHLISRGT